MTNLFNGFIEKEINMNENNEIHEKRIEYSNINESLLYHPYTEDLSNYEYTNGKTRLILYRINNCNKYNFIEYYLNDIYCECDKEIILKNLIYLPGRKNIKGKIKEGDSMFTIIQIRDNKNKENWVTLWDIIINKHYYGEKIDNKLVSFMLNNNKLDNLFIKDKICNKPIILYCFVDEKYKNYINKYNSVQYCQDTRNILINLSEYKPGYNVRNICFLHDREIDNDLKNNDFIVERNEEGYKWIIKNDKNIISFLK